jgi:hypothetical protein
LSKSSAETGKRVETNANITKIGPTDRKGQKLTLNPKIFKATRSRRILRKTVFPDSVLLLIKESKVVHIERESTLRILTAPFKAITIKEAMKSDPKS